MDGYRVARVIVGALGAVYVVIGAVGFVATGLDGFAAREGEQLLGILEVNPLHNVVHIVVGLGLLGALALRPGGAAALTATIGAVLLLLAIFGPLLDGTEGNVLALNLADHWLHAVTGLVALGAAYFLRRPDVRADERMGRAA